MQLSNELKEVLTQDFNNFLLWGLPPDERTEEEKYIDDCKFAYVFEKEGDTIHMEMVFVNNKDMKAYEKEGYETCRLDKPVDYFKFDRWCRPMDM